MSKLDYTKESDDEWGIKGSDGLQYESLANFLQVGTLGFCACGDPEGNLLYIKEGLQFFDQKHALYEQVFGNEIPDLFSPALAKKSKECEDKVECLARSIFGNDQSALFFKYWADKEGYTEHGSNVDGSWLTEEGQKLIVLIEKALAEISPGENYF